SNLNVVEEFLNEWFPAESRMGFIKGNNYIVLELIGGILWAIFISISFVLKRIIPSFIQKLKYE
ncbi:hypothetical protein RhiirA5_443522, partial [Rhizophagus irregularis]